LPVITISGWAPGGAVGGDAFAVEVPLTAKSARSKLIFGMGATGFEREIFG